MQRTIEKLKSQREKKEQEFFHKLKDLDKLNSELASLDLPEKIKDLISMVEEPAAAPSSSDSITKRPGPSLRRKGGKRAAGDAPTSKETLLVISEFYRMFEQYRCFTRKAISSFTELVKQTEALMEVRDREWDALGSNHVNMIFKSMEWKIEDLSALYQDANSLMKKFIMIKEKLNRLLAELEGKKSPREEPIKEVVRPIEDWRYAGFENRHRGTQQEVKTQLERYLPCFQKGDKVVDLGCGRGEFLELLKEKGIDAEGVDANQQMISTCLEKGLNCHHGDILDKLAEYDDQSLGGIFSSQVVEHLEPEYLRRMVELCYSKLMPQGCIVLETINPASVFSLVHVYFLDLSHQRPIHPQTLKFLLESSGFEDVRIDYSVDIEQEKLESVPPSMEGAEVTNRNVDKLNRLLFDAAHYAGIGIK